MADTGQSSTAINSTLQDQQAAYLKSVSDSGNLPKVISDAWNANGGADTAALTANEGDLLKNYVAAGANARQQFSNVWDPFARDALVAKQVSLDYAPIATVRNELSMRAQALGVATTAATAMNNANLNSQKTAIGFTQDAYTRAYQKEQDAAARAAAATKSSAPIAASNALQLKQDVADTSNYLSKGTGKDGYVSATTFKNALNSWLSGGNSANDFYTNFWQEVNPNTFTQKDWESYGISAAAYDKLSGKNY